MHIAGRGKMGNFAVRSQTYNKLEKLVGLFSGVMGIISFVRDFPLLGFLLLVVFAGLVFRIYQKDYIEVTSRPVNSKKEKAIYIFQELVIERGAFIFIILLIGILFVAIHFLYREAKFKLNNGWVETIEFQYKFGMLPIHLISINQSERSLELLQKINPVLYYDDTYAKNVEISFETKDIDICGNDQPCVDTYFGVDVIGLDPKNEFLEPAGNFVNHFDTSGYTRYKIGDNYTLFLKLNDCPAKGECVVRFHFTFKESWSSSSDLNTTIYISYLYDGSYRFTNMVQP